MIRPTDSIVTPYYQQNAFTQCATEKKLLAQPQYQENTNACGTTSLAIALNSLASMERNNPTFTPFHFRQLDAGNRELNGFSSPDMLARVARQNGAFAQMVNHMTFDEIRTHIDAGHPILALVSNDRETLTGSLHWQVIYGYYGADSPEAQGLHIMDPAMNASCTVEFSRYQSTRFSDIRFADSVSTGFSNFGIVLSSRDDLGKDRSVPAVNWLATGLNNVMANVGQLAKLFNAPVSSMPTPSGPLPPFQDIPDVASIAVATSDSRRLPPETYLASNGP